MYIATKIAVHWNSCMDSEHKTER